MSKRRAADELYGDSAKRADHTGRGAEFTAHLRGLNSQFAQWAQQQAAQAGDQLWLAGVKDYIRHADKLLEQFDDALVNGNQHRSSSPLASNLFGTPVPAANGAAAAADAAGGATGRSTGFGGGGGRKSVTFAEQPNFGSAEGSAAAATPAFGTAAGAATPGTANTANAGHTPAPTSGLGFSFGATPSASPAAKNGELPSPEPFRLGGSVTPSSAGGAAGISPGPSTGGFSFGAAPTPAAGGSGSGSGFGFTVAGAAAAAAAAGATPAPATGSGFTFGLSSSSTPARQDPAAAGTSSSNGAGFSFGASPAAEAASGSAGGFTFGASPATTAAAADGSGGSGPAATTFSFGALPSSSSAAAAAGGSAGGGSSTAAFGFATTPAAGSGAAGAGLFKFPAPGAGPSDGAAAAASGADADAGDEEAPQKFTPELKVDESTWNVLFSCKAKLYIRLTKDNGTAEWQGRGVGMLTVRRLKQGSDDKTYVMFSTDVGKQLVSSALRNSSSVMIIPDSPTKCRMSLFVTQYDLPPAGKQAAGDADTTKKRAFALQVCMLTLSTAEKVEEFAKLVQQHKPQ